MRFTRGDAMKFAIDRIVAERAFDAITAKG